MNTVAKDQDSLATPAVNAASSAISEATIERDSKTGSVLRIIENGQNKRANPLNDPLNELEDSDPEEWEGFDNVPAVGSGPQTEVLSKLESLASSGVRTAPRKQSQREQEWIQKLVEKYGDNYGKMFRDVKLNPMQQSEGDIKRRVLKWKSTKEKAS
jgi:nucleolar protein 16